MINKYSIFFDIHDEPTWSLTEAKGYFGCLVRSPDQEYFELFFSQTPRHNQNYVKEANDIFLDRITKQNVITAVNEFVKLGGLSKLTPIENIEEVLKREKELYDDYHLEEIVLD